MARGQSKLPLAWRTDGRQDQSAPSCLLIVLVEKFIIVFNK
ncbi:MAG: hypothetical protein AAF533_23190 [Acidobacteriota bacterium]